MVDGDGVGGEAVEVVVSLRIHRQMRKNIRVLGDVEVGNCSSGAKRSRVLRSHWSKRD
jgi:hypothetical protein